VIAVELDQISKIATVRHIKNAWSWDVPRVTLPGKWFDPISKLPILSDISSLFWYWSQLLILLMNIGHSLRRGYQWYLLLIYKCCIMLLWIIRRFPWLRSVRK
jgi:hypothetical protein